MKTEIVYENEKIIIVETGLRGPAGPTGPAGGAGDLGAGTDAELVQTNAAGTALARAGQTVAALTALIPTVPGDIGAAAASHTHALADLTQSGATPGQVAAWNGAAWAPASVGGSGTVTSVGATGSTGLTVGGSPITASGTITFTLSANLQSWSAIAPAAKLDASALSAFGLTLVDDADAATARATLGLGTAATAASSAFEAAGAVSTHNGVTTAHGISAFGATLVDDVDASAARTTLGLGTAAVAASGDFAAASHNHAASAITSGTLAHERGGLEADVSAYSGLVKITAGATSAVTVTAAGEALLDDADNTAQRATLGLVIGTDVQAYSAVLAATTASFTTADEAKLDGIEALADVTDAANVGAAIAGATAKTTAIGADSFGLIDSADSNALKDLTLANLIASLVGLTSAQMPTADIVTESGTTRAMANSDAGKLIRCTNAAGCVVTFPDTLTAEKSFALLQAVGAGPVEWAVSGSMVATPSGDLRAAHTESGGEGSIVTAFVDATNSVIIGGDTA